MLVGEALHHLNFLVKPLRKLRLLLPNHLHRHDVTGLPVVRTPDDAHPAASCDSDELEALSDEFGVVHLVLG